MYKIGLSLSGCIYDIMTGEVDIKDVVVILTATRISSNKDWDDVMRHYYHGPWNELPEYCVRIAEELRDSGRLIHPRVTLNKMHGGAHDNWLDLSKPINLHKFDIFSCNPKGSRPAHTLLNS